MTLCKGGRVAICSSIDKLFEEFQLVRPTLISAVPRCLFPYLCVQKLKSRLVN